MLKASKGLKEPELKYYQHCQRFLKDKVMENGDMHIEHNRRPRTAHDTRDMILQFRSDYLGMHPSQTGSTLVARTVPLLDETVKYTGLNDEDSDLEDNKDNKLSNLKNIPKQIPLISRKTRRCLNCKKLLTKSFKTFKS